MTYETLSEIGYEPITYGIGELAYFDAFSGVVKCKVIEIRDGNWVKAIVTGTKAKVYRKGEHILTHGKFMVPRKHLVTRNGHHWIKPNFVWENI